MHQRLPGRHPFLSLRALFAALAVCAAEPEPALPDELKALPAGAVAAGARMPTPRHVVEAIRTCYAIDLLQACRDDFGPGTVEALSPLLGQIQALRARERVLYDMQAEYLERIALGRTTLGKARPVLEKTGARIAEHLAAQARLLEDALHGPEGVHNDPALPHAGRVRVPGPAAGRGGGRRGWRATSHPPTRRAADPLIRNKVALLHRLSDEAETMLTCAPWASWGALYGERETRPFLKWEDQALVLVDPVEDAREEAASQARIAAAAEREAAAAARKHAKVRHEAERHAAKEAARALKARQRADAEKARTLAAERLVNEAAERKAQAEAAERKAQAEAAERMVQARAAGRKAQAEAAERMAQAEAAERLAQAEAAERKAQAEATWHREVMARRAAEAAVAAEPADPSAMEKTDEPRAVPADPPSPSGVPEAMGMGMGAEPAAPRPERRPYPRTRPHAPPSCDPSWGTGPGDARGQAERALDFARMDELAANFAELEADRQRQAEHAAIQAAFTASFNLHLHYFLTHPFPHPFAPLAGPLPSPPPPSPPPPARHRLNPLAAPFKPAERP